MTSLSVGDGRDASAHGDEGVEDGHRLAVGDDPGLADGAEDVHAVAGFFGNDEGIAVLQFVVLGGVAADEHRVEVHGDDFATVLALKGGASEVASVGDDAAALAEKIEEAFAFAEREGSGSLHEADDASLDAAELGNGDADARIAESEFGDVAGAEVRREFGNGLSDGGDVSMKGAATLPSIPMGTSTLMLTSVPAAITWIRMTSSAWRRYAFVFRCLRKGKHGEKEHYQNAQFVTNCSVHGSHSKVA